MSGLGLSNPPKKPDKTRVTRDKAERLDMSELGLWNPGKEPDKAERPNMSGLGAGHVWVRSLESGLGAGYIWPDRRFGW
jgi:hypothetical protein